MSTAYTVVIPARYASTRLPGKPLQDIAGKPMIRHVWEQARKSAAQRVVIATDDQRIVDACTAFGAEVVLTRAEHNSGTDRLAEVAEQLGLPGDAIVVNVQGDEPMIPPAVIDQVAANLADHPEAAIATLAEPLADAQALFNPNVVKVLSDINGLALTFSRAPLPWARDSFAVDRSQLPPGAPYRYLCLPCWIPGRLRILGPVLAGGYGVSGAAACALAWAAHPCRRCRRSSSRRGRHG